MTLAPHDAPRNQSPSQLAEALGPERPRSPACGPLWRSPMACSTPRASRRSEAQRQLPRLGRANQRRRAARDPTRSDCFPQDAAAPYVSARFRPRNPTSAAAEHQRRASAITHRVNWSPVDPHLEVQMWAVAMAGTTHRGDLLATSAPTDNKGRTRQSRAFSHGARSDRTNLSLCDCHRLPLSVQPAGRAGRANAAAFVTCRLLDSSKQGRAEAPRNVGAAL
jgi:hypothetical protein